MENNFIQILFLFYVIQRPPNTFFLEPALKKTIEYIVKFLFFIWKYNPFG